MNITTQIYIYITTSRKAFSKKKNEKKNGTYNTVEDVESVGR